MLKKLTILLVAANFAAVGMTGCKSQTDDKPAAKVEDAEAEEAKTEGEEAKEGDDAKEEGAMAKEGDDAKEEGDAKAEMTEVAVNTEESKIGFVGAKVTGDHEGGFKKFDGKMMLDEEGNLAKVAFNVDTTSIFTDTEKLTGHLKSDDFFHVEKYPKASFESTEITEGSDVKPGEGQEAFTHTIKGKMDLHGVEKVITFPARVDTSGDMIKASTEFNLNRFDFKIEYKGKPDDLIKKEVLMKIDLKAPKPKA